MVPTTSQTVRKNSFYWLTDDQNDVKDNAIDYRDLSSDVMKLNQTTILVGHKSILVPYRTEHVFKYHSWMLNAELRDLTASELLTLDEEYEMQQTWLNDEDKCTFIILNRQTYESSDQNEVESMVGDVNLFLNDPENNSAEIEIMIADVGSRGQGLGLEAILSMIHYGITSIGLRQFTAKIGFNNHKSQTLFQKLGFREVSRTDIFQEVTLQLCVDPSFRSWLDDQTRHLLIEDRTAIQIQ